MKRLFLVISMIISTNAFSAIVCHTPRLNKIFEIKDNKVTFYKEWEQNPQRVIASIDSRSKNVPSGITKILDLDNHKHTIHIENVNQFNDSNDYIIIKAKTGHEVIYPLSCQNN